MSEDLPDGWARARIADVFEVNPRKPAADHVREGTPVSFVPMGAVDADRGAITAPEERTFGAVRKGYTAFADGDVLLAKITPCFENGKAAVASSLLNGLGFGSSEFHVFRSRGAVLAPYLFHYLRQPQLRADAAEFMTGTAGQARVPIDYLSNLELPVAPLAEQRRIVAKVESLLEQVRRAKDRLDRVPLIMKRFRQAVLAAACTGDLTDQWRSKSDFPAWKEVTLADVAASFSYGTAAKSAKQGTVPVLRMGNIQSGRLDWTDLVFTSDPAEIEKFALRTGDVLFNRTNSPELVGKTAVYRGEQQAIYAGYLIRVRCLPMLIPDYLNFCLSSPKGRDYCQQVKSDGVSQSNINSVKLAAFSFDLPGIEEQAEVVCRVDGLFALATAIEQRVERAAARAGTLPQAILSRAFAGELAPTEADLARAEGRNYETAEQLLGSVARDAEQASATRDDDKSRRSRRPARRQRAGR